MHAAVGKSHKMIMNSSSIKLVDLVGRDADVAVRERAIKGNSASQNKGRVCAQAQFITALMTVIENRFKCRPRK